MITTRQQILAAITDLWGGLKIDSFDQRLLLQKRMFFLAMLGVDLGYSHSWYIRGPYSTALTKDAFDIDEQSKSHGNITPIKLPNNLITKIIEVQALFGDEWNEPLTLELYASLYHLSVNYNSQNLDFLREKLLNLKSHFSSDDVDRAFAKLQEKGIL